MFIRILNRNIALLMCVGILSSGCSHQLQVKNLSAYRPEYIGNIPENLNVGIVSSIDGSEEQRLLISCINSLKSNGLGVVYPYNISSNSKNEVDYILKISSTSRHDGSGTNFWINWPGFLIWTPAWHGYNYQVVYIFDIDIIDSATKKSFPHLSIPVDLDIRHAAMNRTWTEISWLEWGAIALIGGIIFTKYDPTVTPLLLDYSENKIGDYVGSKITNAIGAIQPKVLVPVAIGTEMKVA